jgi:rsbT co-antagonist protein RsbR
MAEDNPNPIPVHRVTESTAALLRELVAHLRQSRTQLREEWARRITEAQLLTAMSKEEIFAEATAVYDNYVDVLETGAVEALQDYARNLSERIIPRGVETHEVVGIVLLLRDVLARSLFSKYRQDFDKLSRVLDAYEPAANRIGSTVAVSFVQERERIIREQQEAIRELSTPVLPVRERLLILPIIGMVDPLRARQLTEQLLRGIRTNRARVVVMDITGVPAMDATVANHLVQTVEASRLLGAVVIVTGLSPELAQTLVNIGVDLSKMNTVGDLQGGIEEAERLLGYKVTPIEEPPWKARRRRASSNSQTTRLFDRQHSSRAHRCRLAAPARRAREPGRHVPLARRHRRRHGARRDGLLRRAHLARSRSHDPAPRRGDRHRRHPARGLVRDGATGLDSRRRVHRLRPGRGSRLPGQKTQNDHRAAEQEKDLTLASQEIAVPVNADIDIVTARQRGRELARELGFTSTDLALIATAISELARNIILYANTGQIILAVSENGTKRGIKVVARDEGPGIPDVERALEEGFSTSRSLGLGLSGVRRLMDEFDIVSELGRGTTVTVKKWKL